MTNTKIKIDLGQGIVEAEGSERFVQSIYDDFKGRLDPKSQPVTQKQTSKTKGNKQSANSSKSTPKKSKTKGDLPKIVAALDLSGAGQSERLQDFYAKYKPKSNFHNNLIFVYHLQQNLGLAGITVDHVFTCYRDILKLKAPEALWQSLRDTSRRQGWLEAISRKDIKLTMSGMNYLEHNMPKADED